MFECQDEPARRCSAIVAASGKSNGRRGKLDFDDKKFGEVSCQTKEGFFLQNSKLGERLIPQSIHIEGYTS